MIDDYKKNIERRMGVRDAIYNTLNQKQYHT